MRAKNIELPRIGLVAWPFYTGGSERVLGGHEYYFILWDQAGRSANWFDENREDVMSRLDMLHAYPDYSEAFDLHHIEPRESPFNRIDIAQLTDESEVCVPHFLGGSQAYGFHMLFVRRVGDQYVLNGGLVAIMDGDPPMRLDDVDEKDREEFFEVRVPADAFTVEYDAAVERYHREEFLHLRGA